MHEDQNDETPQNAGRPDMELASDAAVPEDPAQAIALPAKTPTPPQEPELTPTAAQPDTPPLGVPQGSPQGVAPGTYAMGALAGHPVPVPDAGPSTGSDVPYGTGPGADYGAGTGYGAGYQYGGPGFGAPPTQPSAQSWYTPGAGGASAVGKSDHRVRNAALGRWGGGSAPRSGRRHRPRRVDLGRCPTGRLHLPQAAASCRSVPAAPAWGTAAAVRATGLPSAAPSATRATRVTPAVRAQVRPAPPARAT